MQRIQRVPSSDIPPPGTIGHCRAPAVEHGGGADARAEMFGIFPRMRKHLGARGKERSVYPEAAAARVKDAVVMAGADAGAVSKCCLEFTLSIAAIKNIEIVN